MRTLQRVMIATAIATGVAALTAMPGPAQVQQKFPSKPIRLVVTATPGSQPDTLARMIGHKLSESWGRAVVVDNRPGGGGTLKDLIALAKAQPGKIIFGSNAVGSANHLSGARFNLAAGIKVITVAFQGGPAATIEVLAGRAHYSIVTLVVALPFIKDGKLLALAVLTPQRSPVLPDVPALAETLSDFKKPESSTVLLAPAKTPRPILIQISKEVARVLSMPDIKERLQGFGFAPAPSTPEEYDNILREQIATLSRLVKDAGLRSK